MSSRGDGLGSNYRAAARGGKREGEGSKFRALGCLLSEHGVVHNEKRDLRFLARRNQSRVKGSQERIRMAEVAPASALRARNPIQKLDGRESSGGYGRRIRRARDKGDQQGRVVRPST
jgi:hypothetical protein